jgi:hypothetical protein
MKIFETSWPRAVALAGALALAAAGPLRASPETPTPAVGTLLVVAAENQAAVQIKLGRKFAAGELLVAVAPRHGGVQLGTSTVTYFLPAGYIGRDSVTLLLAGVEVRVELRILPRRMPFTGRFDGAYRGAGLWDNLTRTFLLCGQPIENVEELPCQALAVSGLPDGALIPLAWPQPTGEERPALFDLVSGRLLRLELHDGAFRAAGWMVELPALPGAWPIIGDFFGSGESHLAMVAENGDVYLLGTKNWELWPHRMNVPQGDGLVWPIQLPHPGGDLVVLAELATGTLLLFPFDPAGDNLPGVRGYGIGDYRRPLCWSRTGDGMSFLRIVDGELYLKPGNYVSTNYNPSTIPVKFPDDPAGGGGG